MCYKSLRSGSDNKFVMALKAQDFESKPLRSLKTWAKMYLKVPSGAVQHPTLLGSENSTSFVVTILSVVP